MKCSAVNRNLNGVIFNFNRTKTGLNCVAIEMCNALFEVNRTKMQTALLWNQTRALMRANGADCCIFIEGEPRRVRAAAGRRGAALGPRPLTYHVAWHHLKHELGVDWLLAVLDTTWATPLGRQTVRPPSLLLYSHDHRSCETNQLSINNYLYLCQAGYRSSYLSHVT